MTLPAGAGSRTAAGSDFLLSRLPIACGSADFAARKSSSLGLLLVDASHAAGAVVACAEPATGCPVPAIGSASDASHDEEGRDSEFLHRFTL